MKTSLLLLLLGLMLGGCSKPPAGRTLSPVHTNLEVYATGQGQAAMPIQFGKDIAPRWDFTATLGGIAYSVGIEYKGSQNERDYYWVALTLPQGAVGVPAPAEIAYDGQPIKLWSDSKTSIGFRRPCRLIRALQRTRHGVAVCNRGVPRAGSLSFGR